MKNIHILPTDNPSDLLLCIKDYTEHKDTPAENSDTKGNYRLGFGKYANRTFYQPQNIYITSDEEIKVGDWCIDEDGLMKCTAHAGAMNHYFQKIILTTDAELIKDGVQGIDDEFLEWFVMNPSCEEVKVESKITKDGVWTDLKGYVELPTTHSIIHKIIIPKEENIWKK